MALVRVTSRGKGGALYAVGCPGTWGTRVYWREALAAVLLREAPLLPLARYRVLGEAPHGEPPPP